MESYVRKCTLFAIIFVIAGLLVGFRSYTRSKVEPVPALEVIEPDYTQPSAVVEAELTKLTTRVYKADDVNLPDDSIPEHKNAVEPPTTEETVTESVEMTEYATEPETAEVQTITQAPEIGRYASLVNLISDDDKELLARLIYHESRGVGGEAVCETVFNRMLSDEFPDSVYDVINRENQLSRPAFYGRLRLKSPKLWPAVVRLWTRCFTQKGIIPSQKITAIFTVEVFVSRKVLIMNTAETFSSKTMRKSPSAALVAAVFLLRQMI